MRVKYLYHKEKKMCCGMENKFMARIYFVCYNLPFCLTGCGDTKKEAKNNLIKRIKEQTGAISDALVKYGFK